MAWTAPITFVANTGLTAAQLNTYLRDNMNETAPAKATTPGYHFVSTGPNAIAERAWESSFIDTSQGTTSTTFVDLATVGPQVTIETGSKALWFINCFTAAPVANTARRASVEVTGASSIAASDNTGILHDVTSVSPNGVRTAACHMETGLTPGTNTFTMKYRSGGGTVNFVQRELIVIGL